ncbi:hypothetical protein ACFQET_07600 [Levilactobacillus tangyuanensis]|uniref:Transcriptional regulator n=1 Tax=Levilactobacillus tangyuanensis TaxID=2486021 RepID=A0ABW1TQG1_9LACO|nr:hypothetical protein [Levilactobacillus tangyuanensis]
MELGPLSEWIGALAEFLAVGVALFLPYWTTHRMANQRRTKFKTVILRYGHAALAGDLTATKDLEIFLKVAFLVDTDDHCQSAISTGFAILNELDSPITPNRQQRVEVLLASLTVRKK